jgi:hypothetical protein
MIKINVFKQEDFNKILEVKAAAEAFFQKRGDLTFSGRNPELGKMVMCRVCDRRHRSSHTCVQRFAKARYAFDTNGEPTPLDLRPDLIADQSTKFGVVGKANFKGRILRHRNAWGLQVLERATKIFNVEMSSFPNINDPDATPEQKKANQEFVDKTGKSSLSRSLNEKRAERADRRRNLHQITRKSRQINRGA